jgi:aminopeptidase N
MRQFLIAAALFLSCLGGPAAAQVGQAAPGHPAAVLQKSRLSDAVRPVAYRLDLTIDPARERFSGRVEIDARVEQPRAAIMLDGRGLAVHRVSASFGPRLLEGSWRETGPNGLATVSFPEPLPAGPVTFAFDYDAPFYADPTGMFHVKVAGDWYSWTQFEATDARAAFPCFDQPSFKTPFTLTLRTPPGLVAVSNAPELSKSLEAGLEVHRFAPTLPLPTYLVAMMVGPFAMLEGAVPPTPERAKPLPLRIISTRQNGGRLAFALEGTERIVTLLEAYFGEPFPFPKLDQVTSPIMPGAMENAGADLYNDSLIVMDGDAPVSQQQRFGMVVAHELSHQWFGDLVTPAWWDDIWLNESFANWMGHRIGDSWRPDLDIRAGALAEGFAAMKTDALTAGRPIRQKIDFDAQIDSAFDSITYGKGGAVIAMIAGFLGEDTFRAGVRSYLAAHRYGSAASADFFKALGEAAGDDRIVAAMRSFTDQQGVPLLVVTHQGDVYTVSQHRYAPFGASPRPELWDVPMCVRRGAARLCRLLTEKSASFTFAGAGPLVPNAGGSGYYRFEMTERDWNALIAKAGELSGGEAQAVADSLAASLLAGRAQVYQLARLTRELLRDPANPEADAATDALSDLADSGVIDAPGKQAWRALRGRLYAPLLAKLGFDPRAGAYAGESPDKAQRRVEIVSRMLGTTRDGKLRRKLLAAAEAYIRGDAAALDPVGFDVAFDAYLRRGGLEAAKLLTAKALASEDPAFRPAALDAVAESGSKPVAHWLLYELADPRLRSSEKRELLQGVLLASSTRDLGYQWLTDHLDELMSGGSGIFFASRLPGLLGSFCSVERAQQFAQDLRPRLAGKTGALELERAIEKVRNCGVLHDQLGEQLSEEFDKLR